MMKLSEQYFKIEFMYFDFWHEGRHWRKKEAFILWFILLCSMLLNWYSSAINDLK